MIVLRSPLWYAVAVVIGAAGLAGCWLYLAPRLHAFDAGLQRVVMPDPAVVTFGQPGAYTIYVEINGVIDGRLYDRPPPSGARVTLISETTGKAVPLNAVHASVEYEVGARKGHAVLGFVIDQPGRYKLAANRSTDTPYVLAIARGSAMGSMGGLFRTITVTVCLGMASFGIAGLIIAMTAIQRGKDKRAVKV